MLCSVWGPLLQEGYLVARAYNEKSKEADEGTGKQDLLGLNEGSGDAFSLAEVAERQTS